MSSFLSTTLDTFEVVPRGKDEPVLVDPHSLAYHLGFSGRALWYAVRFRDALYKTFDKPKASGGTRTIHAPSPYMRLIGKQLRRKFLTPECDELGLHVTAYRKGQSTLDAAKRHLLPCPTCAPADGEHTCSFVGDATGHVRKIDVATCAACVPVPKHACPRRGVKIHMDLSDFFGSTKRSWIRGYLHGDLGYSHQVSSLVSQLLTVTLKDDNRKTVHHGVPQGGKASGDITNLVADIRLDTPMLGMLKKESVSWVYSRYADDLYFSCPDNVPYAATNVFLEKVRHVIRSSGYRINEKKTHVQRAHKQQKLLGVVLNQKLNMPRNEYRRFRAMLHRCWCDGFEVVATRMNKSSGAELQGWIEGKLAYYTNLSPQRAKELKLRYQLAQAKFPAGSEMSFTFGTAVTP